MPKDYYNRICPLAFLHAYVYLEFLILACTIYILAPALKC